MNSGVPALLRALGAHGVAVTTSGPTCEKAGVDWTGRFRGDVLAVARPTSTEQVSLVLNAAGAAGVPVQIQGGNTGLVGGSVPAPGVPSLVLATNGLQQIGAVSAASRQLTVGAGVTCADAAAAAARAGLYLGVDLAARDSATIGGMAATNAGGRRVCAFGMMRANVRGVRAVLPDGSVVDTTRALAKDNTGYDLTGLLVGSEGTLAVITEVVLGLHERPPAASLAVVGVPSLAAAVAAARAVQAAGVRVLAAEVVDAAGMHLVARLQGLPVLAPVAAGEQPWWLFVEVADGGDCSGLEPLGELASLVADNPADQARLWAYREYQPLAYAAAAGRQAVHKFDVSVPLELLDALAGGFAERMGWQADVRGTGCFGHALEGNLHLQCWGSPAAAEAPTVAVLGLVAELGGSISAEHGIGRAKAPYLHLSRGPGELALSRAIRRACDPAALLNPGVLIG